MEPRVYYKLVSHTIYSYDNVPINVNINCKLLMTFVIYRVLVRSAFLSVSDPGRLHRIFAAEDVGQDFLYTALLLEIFVLT